MNVFKDIMIHWLKIVIFPHFYPPQSQLKPSQVGSPGTHGMKVIKNTTVLG